ncbi:MAG TPA: hypothetical protein PLP42_22200 [Acidobacteriota bacterium]|nr:hypothetical protein [Acidobacteriota bacterium]
MAWKMIDTIFDQYRIPTREQNVLLTAVTGIALDDLVKSDVVRFKKALPPMTILLLDGRSVRTKAARKTRLALKTEPVPEDIDRAFEWVEKIFDKYNLTEEERATLYTALPCVGLHTLAQYVEWKQPPPFTELGEAGE